MSVEACYPFRKRAGHRLICSSPHARWANHTPNTTTICHEPRSFGWNQHMFLSIVSSACVASRAPWPIRPPGGHSWARPRVDYHAPRMYLCCW